eukprot:EG_transcript_14207
MGGHDLADCSASNTTAATAVAQLVTTSVPVTQGPKLSPVEATLQALRRENAVLEAQYAALHARWTALQEESAEAFLQAYLQTPPDIQAKLEGQFKELSRQYQLELSVRRHHRRRSHLKKLKRLRRLLEAHDRAIAVLRERHSELHVRVQRNERTLQRSEGLALRVHQQRQGDQQDLRMLQRLVEREEALQQRAQLTVRRRQRRLEELQAADPFPAIPYNVVKEIVQRRREAAEADRQVQDLTLKVEALQEWLRQARRQRLSQRCAAAWDAVIHREDQGAEDDPLEHEAAMLQRLIAEWTVRLQRMENLPPAPPLLSPDDVQHGQWVCHTPPVPRLHLFSSRLKAAPLSTRCSPRAAVQEDSPLARHLPQATGSPSVITAQKRDLLRY